MELYTHSQLKKSFKHNFAWGILIYLVCLLPTLLYGTGEVAELIMMLLLISSYGLIFISGPVFLIGLTVLIAVCMLIAKAMLKRRGIHYSFWVNLLANLFGVVFYGFTVWLLAYLNI
ncbi:MAG: hypothetical protein ACRC5C_09705 [Bacilli bacterium]